MKKWISSIVLVVSFLGWSQNYEGEIKNIQTNSLYQIELTPEIIMVNQKDILHLRLFLKKV